MKKILDSNGYARDEASNRVGQPMVETPWGDSETLRSGQLSPGPGTAAEAVAENQRRRLFGAMVAAVVTQGYEAARVSDLSEISGVSSRSFYKLFPGGKEECFLAVLEQILDAGVTALSTADDREEEWLQRLRLTYEGAARLISAQPAAAGLVLTEAYAAGPAALAIVDRAVAAVERLSRRRLKESPERRGLPPAMIQAHIGAMQELARSRLRRGEADALLPLVPQLVDLVGGYRPPPQPLRLATRTNVFEIESAVAVDDAERAIHGFILAVAKHGYPGATIQEIARLGSMSPSTFYANFRDKRAVLLAAIDSSMAQLQALASAAYRRSPGWAPGVRSVIGSCLTFLASRPATANLLLIEVYAGGPEALEIRARGMRDLTRTITAGGPQDAGVPPVAPEVIIGGIVALARRQLLRQGAESLPSLVPISTYIALAPYVGLENACVAANGDGRGRARADEASQPSEHPPARQRKWVIHNRLGNRWATAEELALEIGIPVGDVTRSLEELEKDDLVERITPLDEGKPIEWKNQKNFRLYEGEDWASLTHEERLGLVADGMRQATLDLAESVRSEFAGRRLDEHYTRLVVELDQEGWDELAAIHAVAFEASQVVRAKSERRLRETGETAITARAMQFLFELPDED